VEERPDVSLPAWANSNALVKPAQPDVMPENSKPAFKPVETVPLPREGPMSPDRPRAETMATAASAIGPTIQHPEPTGAMTDGAIPARKFKSAF
jgi:hypothetical protein